MVDTSTALGGDGSPDFPEAKKAVFWEGPTISAKMQAGSFGRFHEAMQKLGDIIPREDFKLARLVVIGNQNRGKSSLLETQSAPSSSRSDDTTTRAPVHLQLEHVHSSTDNLIQIRWRDSQPRILQHVDEIVGAVQSMMDSIPQDVIVSDEITVLIRSPTMINMEFIDLPGIVATPTEKEQQTERLVESYLSIKETLFLCVEEVTNANLDGSQAIGLVRHFKKAQHSIVVLTKSDLLAPGEIRKRLLLRLIRNSREATDYHQAADVFAGVVAVVSRKHHDVKTLLEAGDDEIRRFKIKVFPKLKEMPQRFSDLQPAIRNNIGIGNLISQVEAMYRAFVLKDWKETALKRLVPTSAEAKEALDLLGPHPEDLKPQEVMQEIFVKLDFAKMAEELGASADDDTIKKWTIIVDQAHVKSMLGVGAASATNHLADFTGILETHAFRSLA